MCLALPAKIEERREQNAWVRIGDARLQVNLVMTPDADIGDWVLVHAGFAIQQVTEDDARETWSVIEEAGGIEAFNAPDDAAFESEVRS